MGGVSRDWTSHAPFRPSCSGSQPTQWPPSVAGPEMRLITILQAVHGEMTDRPRKLYVRPDTLCADNKCHAGKILVNQCGRASTGIYCTRVSLRKCKKYMQLLVSI